jgi:hypothetical protein
MEEICIERSLGGTFNWALPLVLDLQGELLCKSISNERGDFCDTQGDSSSESRAGKYIQDFSIFSANPL